MKRLVSTAAALMAAAIVQPAWAQEVCVQCDGPTATYRCSVGGSDRVGEFRGRGAVIEYACISELARLGKHERCRVAKNFGSSCLGDPRTVSLSGSGSAGELGAGGQDVDPQAEAAKQAERARNEPPRTLVEAARKTVEQTKSTAQEAGKKLEQAGDAVGGAFKKTWTCIISIFSSC